MDPTKVTLPGRVLAAQGGYIDPFADDSFATHAISSPQQTDDLGFSADPLVDTRSTLLLGQGFDNHPLFRNGQSVISRTGSDELWMQGNAVRLLGLYRIPEIVKSEPHTQSFVVVKFDRSLREIRGFELRPDGIKQPQDGCLLTIRRERGFLAFDKVDATGLPADVAAWFMSLKDRIVRKSLYMQEMRSQAEHNEAAFHTFYHEGLEGMAPEAYSILYAWVALESGRILSVRGVPRLIKKNNGMLTFFKVLKIRDSTVYISCTNRRALAGMPSLYFRYFLDQFIVIRDAVLVVEEDVLEGDGVPHEEAVDVDSDAILGA